MKIRRINNYKKIVGNVQKASLTYDQDGVIREGWKRKPQQDFVSNFYDVAYWEPVPDEPELVDVTHKCDVLNGYSRNSLHRVDGGLLAILPKNYEWRKLDAYVVPEGCISDQYIISVIKQYKQPVLMVWGPKT